MLFLLYYFSLRMLEDFQMHLVYKQNFYYFFNEHRGIPDDLGLLYRMSAFDKVKASSLWCTTSSFSSSPLFPMSTRSFHIPSPPHLLPYSSLSTSSFTSTTYFLLSPSLPPHFLYYPQPQGTMSHDEWEAVGLYLVYAFQKNKIIASQSSDA